MRRYPTAFRLWACGEKALNGVLHQTRGMAKDALAFLERGGGGLPAVLQAFTQKLIGIGTMRPDSDRCHDAESGQAEAQPTFLPRDQQIVAELVLRNQVELIG